ncbi:MAG: undecaprenyl-phosphate glucose phosphotransferase [Methylococcales bacterium]
MQQQRSSGYIRPHQFTLHVLTRALDSASILIGLYISLTLYDVTMSQDYLLPVMGCIALFTVFAEYNGIYQGWRGEPMFDEAWRILLSWLMSFAMVAFCVIFFSSELSFPQKSIQLFLPLVPAFIILTHTIKRLLLAILRQQGFNSRTYAILGANPLGKRLEAALSELPWLGYKLVGYYDDRAEDAYRRLDLKGQLNGGFDELLIAAKQGKVDHIYITLPLRAEERISQMVLELADSTASVNIVPDFFTFNLIQSKWTNVQGIPVVSLFDTPFREFDGVIKRIEDLLLCAFIVPLICVPMLLIAIGIKLSSRGPVLFKQKRYGVNGEEINVWKFRSMTVCENGNDIKQATKNDARITPFGAFLRRTSLDELPQFINVLQGYMSVVGPRPHAVAHNELYRKKIQGYMLRHKVKPGITGLAQISGCRGETDTLDKMEARIHHDLEYLKKWTLWLDLKIVFLTIFKGFVGNQAY